MKSYIEILKSDTYWAMDMQLQFPQPHSNKLIKALEVIAEAAIKKGKAPILELKNLGAVIAEKLDKTPTE